MGKASDPVLAISEDDQTLHVGPAGTLGPHLAETMRAGEPATATREPPARPQLYDTQGRPLTLEAPGDPRASGIASADQAAAAVDEQTLLARIDTALGHMQTVLDRDPERFQSGPDAPRVSRVPRPQGSLSEVLAKLSRLFELDEPEDPKNKGGWLHMLAHAAGTAH